MSRSQLLTLDGPSLAGCELANHWTDVFNCCECTHIFELRMDSSYSNDDHAPSGFIHEIVETLEAHGVPCDSYRLHDFVDAKALEQLTASSTGDVEIRFTVKGTRVAVTKDDVTVLSGGSGDSPGS